MVYIFEGVLKYDMIDSHDSWHTHIRMTHLNHDGRKDFSITWSYWSWNECHILVSYSNEANTVIEEQVVLKYYKGYEFQWINTLAIETKYR